MDTSVRIFTNGRATYLEQEIINFLCEQKNIKVIDIKYTMAMCQTEYEQISTTYSAMVIYEYEY